MLSFLLQSVLSLIQPTTLAAIGVVAALLFVFRRLEFTSPEEQNHPPFIPSVIPFLGQAVTFGKDPIKFLLTSHQKYGDVFSFTMLGKTFTYLIGSDASALFFNSKNEDLNAEDVYSKLVIPIFGKGVAYDAPHSVFLEQKKLLKLGLTIAHFRQYVPLIQEETEDYFRCWGDSDTKDIFVALSELTILTSSRCLHGPEIRQKMDEHVAQLYIDLDGGFSHLAWLLPAWVPLPSFQKRDKARLEMNRIFGEVIKQRREHPNECSEEDILSILINATYKDGRSIPDGEITGMLIAILLAGQHTSSTTGAWLGFFLARDKALQERVYREQLEVCGEDLPPLSFDQLKDLSLLDRCVRETLRLQPPIMTMMRMVRTPQKVGDFTIPAGHQICVSPTINQRLKETWKDPETFNPDRYVKPGDKSEKFAYIPFGAGRHRCIGESFAYVQMKTIWSVLLRKYEFDLCDGYFPPVNYSTMVHTPTRPMIQYRRRKNNREST